MNVNSDHSQAEKDLVFLYALQALSPSESKDFELHLATCASCPQELETLRPVLESFVSWPTDVLRSPTNLWGRIANKIARETDTAPMAPPAIAGARPEWEKVASGISVKILAADMERDRVSMLVRLDPGAEYPGHCHADVEELHLLDGELMIDDKKLHPGDYIRAEAGSIDHRVWSETGCTCVLLTSAEDSLF
jgi:hypothetical protein